MERLADALTTGARRLAAAGVPHPDADVILLAAHLLQTNPGGVRAAAMRGDTAPADLERLVELRAERVPVQLITGETSFCGVDIACAPGVFIPRPETEQLVAWAAAWLRRECPRGGRVVDLCAGTGAVGVALHALAPQAVVTGVELSEAAVRLATRNAERTDGAVTIVAADATQWHPDAGDVVDLVVVNPPYIPPDAVPRDVEVTAYDPSAALYGGGADGLATPRAIIRNVARWLRAGGALAMEHAEVQADALVAYLRAEGWRNVLSHNDLAGKPRFVTARTRPEPTSVADSHP